MKVIRLAMSLWIAPLGAGCSAMRELPRDQYAVRPERRNLTVETQGGDRVRLINARFTADSLTGLRRGAAADSAAVRLALADVSRLTVREVDWYRTGLIVGVAAAAVLAAILSGSDDDEAPVPQPCTKCP